jgi:hypothetical protein
MPQQAVVFNKIMNITEVVHSDVIFICTRCDWSDSVKNLGLFIGFSCCPQCYEFDVRVKDKLLSITS